MTASEKELLELAAKAAGYDANLEFNCDYSLWNDCKCIQSTWNPLTDDGDALRLAVKLKLNIQLEYSPTYHYAHSDEYECLEDMNGCCTKGADCNDDPYAATRRAIVRAAAEIGKEMK